MFDGVTKLGLPQLYDGNAEFYSKEEYQSTLKEKSNEETGEEIHGVATGNQSFKRFRPAFQFWTRIKTIFKETGPLTHEKHCEAKLAL